MKASELSAALLAFSRVTDGDRTSELREFASIFGGGKDETVTARLKRLPAALGIPATLRNSLTAIEAGLIAVDARKQAACVSAVLAKFGNSANILLVDIVSQSRAALESPSPRTPRARAKGASAQPDQMLAKQLADDLTRAVLDTHEFAKLLKQLEDARQVTTPTLVLIGNRFLGNSKSYKGRKAVIADIMKRQGEDMLDNSRRAALRRAS